MYKPLANNSSISLSGNVTFFELKFSFPNCNQYQNTDLGEFRRSWGNSFQVAFSLVSESVTLIYIQQLQNAEANSCYERIHRKLPGGNNTDGSCKGEKGDLGAHRPDNQGSDRWRGSECKANPNSKWAGWNIGHAGWPPNKQDKNSTTALKGRRSSTVICEACG